MQSTNRAQDAADPMPVTRRLVHDRWYYAPGATDTVVSVGRIAQESSTVADIAAQESSSIVADEEALIPAQLVQLVKRFNVEGRNRRNLLKARVKLAWDTKRAERTRSESAAVLNNHTPREFTLEVVRDEPSPDGIPESSTHRVLMTPFEVMYGPPLAQDQGHLSSAIGPMEEVSQELNSFLSQRLNSGGIRDINVVFDEFLDQQLRQFDQVFQDNKRLFLNELDRRVHGEATSLPVISDELRQQRTIALWTGLRRVYFAEPDHDDPLLGDSFFPSRTSSRVRRRSPRVPDDLHAPDPWRKPLDDPDDPFSGTAMPVEPTFSELEEDYEDSIHRESSNGEDENGVNKREPENGESDGDDLFPTETRMIENLCKATDKYEAAMAMQPEAVNSTLTTLTEQLDTTTGFLNLCVENQAIATGDVTGRHNRPIRERLGVFIGEARSKVEEILGSGPIGGANDLKKSWVKRLTLLSTKTMRRILAAKETIHKYGVFVPRNDHEADSSPEAVRWASGRQLEWLRLQEQGTFERNWDWVRLKKAYPQYQKRDVGRVFFVYDHKHSGEHRVRLVFDGSRQNPETYTDTYAPTARRESVRLFHVFAVEEGWTIAHPV
jgi:hypothetical protein